MRTTTQTWPGRLSLMVGHCAGMVDLVALPVWVGALISEYKFDPQHAGALVTSFLLGAVASCLFFAPRFQRLSGRWAAAAGFSLAALTFFGAAALKDFMSLAILHAVAGASAACALSFTHGTIAQSAHPHRLFAISNIALGVFAILFLGATPNLVSAFGGQALFYVFAGVMAFVAVVAAILFPTATSRTHENIVAEIGKIPTAVWFGVTGISCMALNQAMMFSFLEQIGIDRGFGREAVTGVLITLGFVNLLPAPLAAFLEKRVSSRWVLVIGPILQAVIVVLITSGSGFALYAGPAILFAGVMIFTHTFAFGVLAHLDRSARALAGTPAMLMTGAAIGPILGGTLVQTIGYPSLGVAATVMSVCAVVLFSKLHTPAIPATPAVSSLN